MKPLSIALVGCSILSGCASAPPEQDKAAQALLIARMEAKLAADIEKYNAGRPRKTFVRSNSETRFTEYVKQWSAKIEAVGTANYPDEARGRLYGNVQVVVTLRPDGTVESSEISRSSGHQVLDRAALRIVQLASPFAPFPPEILQDTDILVITRTWHFARGDDPAAPRRVTGESPGN